MPLWDELFGSESTSQVYGVFIEYLSQLPVQERERLQDLIYDDNCHLARFALRKELKEKNKVTDFFAKKVRKTIDKFHFVNHIDPWCIENCDPNKVKDLDDVNTEICEQLFRKVNSHSNCKSMNESRYFLFWLYNLDLHNLEQEDLVSASDPRTDYRWIKIKIKEVDMANVVKMDIFTEEEDEINKVTRKLQDVQLDDAETFVCVDCGGGFKNKGYLDHHREKKHGEIVKPFMCDECEKILHSKRNLEEHIQKIHRTCKTCKSKSGDKDTLEKHKRSHSTCTVCGVDMKTKYKLDRHMTTHP